jgi:hypothetical protein
MSPRSNARTSGAGPGSHHLPRIPSGRLTLAQTVRSHLAADSGVLSWSGYAWGAIGVTATFIALTGWWLTQDNSIPIYDAGNHLTLAIYFHNLIQSGDLLGPWNYTSQYPPLGRLVGAFAAFIGGVNVSSPIVGENLVFVSLLSLGCYQAGKLLFGSLAGMLAAIFALGSPLLIAQFHVFMLDAPETALVAVSIWLIIASERFGNIKMSGLAGLAVAAGLLIKVQFPFFIIGIVACALVCGGWRNWRGFMVFAVVSVALGSPWYIDHLTELKTIAKFAGTESGAIPGNTPPTLSVTNLTWYFWNILNSQLLAPLFVLLFAGTLWLIARLYRYRGGLRNKRLELFAGACVAWLAITLTPHHDIRYGMPLMPYLAIIATGWIVNAQSRTVRRTAIGLLVLGVGMNTLGTTFGAGGNVQIALVSSPPSTEAFPDRVRLYTNEGFLVAGPHRDGNVPGLLVDLRNSGVRFIKWNAENPSEFSEEGVAAVVFIANLSGSVTHGLVVAKSADTATLVHESTHSPGPTPCVKLSDGSGVFVLRYSVASRRVSLYCPYHHPRFYGQ